jgi:hypothetical protein
MKHVCYHLVVFGLFVCLAAVNAQADGIVVNENHVLSVNGGTLQMNCRPLTVRAGGELRLVDGAIRLAGLNVEPGGIVHHTGGVIEDGDVDGADLADFIDAFSLADLPPFASAFGSSVCR